MNVVAETEHLVKQLYAPNNPSEVLQIQKRLQELQHTHGWGLADALLHSSDQNVRFFGCLTYTVKINSSGSTLDEVQLEGLLSKLLDWLVRCVKAEDGLLVLRKLCSTLVTYFVLPTASWTLAIRHVLCCLQSGQSLPGKALEQFPPTNDVLPLLRSAQLNLLQIFATNLAEDAARIEYTQRSNATHERIRANMGDALTIIEYNLDGAAEQTADSIGETLKCYSAWVSYGRQEFESSSHEMGMLRQVFGKIVQCLAFEELFETVAEFLTDLFTGSDTFLSTKEIRDFAALLAAPWAQALMSKLDEDDVDYAAILFEEMVLAFGQSSATTILKDPQHYAHIMQMAHRITRTQNADDIEQALSNLVVDYWETMVSLAETVDDIDGGFRLMGSDWLQAMEELCAAMVLPIDSTGEFKRFSQDDLISDFRYRVKDAILTSLTTFGVVVLMKLGSMAIECYNNKRPPECWPMIEAIFHCTTGLAESLDERGEEDTIIQQLFTSQLYKDLMNFDTAIPTKLRRKAMNIIGEYDQFFGRHPDFLLSGIETLFKCLEYPKLTEDAARGILKLCDVNRGMLVPKLDAFIEIAGNFFQAGQTDAKSREDICGSLAAIIQAIPEDTSRMTAINKLLTFVSNDYTSRAEALVVSADADAIQDLKIQTLNQLVSIGRQSQDPQDNAIDLTAEDTIEDTTIWSISHTIIISLLSTVLTNSMTNPSVFPLACEVLQMGYKERTAGPFVFTPDITVTLLTTIDLNNPRIDAAIKTASLFVSSNNSKPDRIAAFLPPILPWLGKLVHSATTTNPLQPTLPPSPDPDFTYSIIDFLSRLIPKHIAYLSALPQAALDTLFALTIHALRANDTLPKRAAAGLWTDLLSLTPTPTTLPFLTHLLTTLGPQLAHALLFNFSGHASKSQLDWLSEPYRKLIARGPRLGVPWKMWTETALTDPGLGYQGREGRVALQEKERFVRQIEHLRGERRTKDVVREFWMACRGLGAGYAA